MKIKIYTRPGCPKCKILHSKLDQKGIEYEECQDVNLMISQGFTSAPMMEVEDKILGFKEAVDWIKEH